MGNKEGGGGGGVGVTLRKLITPELNHEKFGGKSKSSTSNGKKERDAPTVLIALRPDTLQKVKMSSGGGKSV